MGPGAVGSRQGVGGVWFEGRMVNAPVIAHAQTILAAAEQGTADRWFGHDAQGRADARATRQSSGGHGHREACRGGRFRLPRVRRARPLSRPDTERVRLSRRCCGRHEAHPTAERAHGGAAVPAGLLAKMAATLDRVSGGRFDLGIGVGGEYPPEFAACGVPVGERGTRTDESLEICTRLFAGQTLTLKGKFASIEGQRLDPLPIQPGGPPLWVGGRREAAMGRSRPIRQPLAAVHGQPGTAQQQPGQGAGCRNGCRSTAVGHRWRDLRLAVGRQRSRRRSVHRVGHPRRGLPAGLCTTCRPLRAHRYSAAGRQPLAEYVNAGAESMLLSPACPATELPDRIDVLARDVLPGLRALSGQGHDDRRIRHDDQQGDPR